VEKMSRNQSDAFLLNKIAGYTEILAKDPHAMVFVSLCEAYRQMGMLDEALDIAIKEGVRDLPLFSPGYTILAQIHAQRGALDEAASFFEKALSIDRKSPSALKGLARVLLLKGEKDRARELLKRATSLEPDDATVKKMLAVLETKSELPDSTSSSKAAASAESDASKVQSSTKTGDPVSTVTIAELYARQGFPKRALKVYRDLLQADPQNEEIRQKFVALGKQIDAENAQSRQEAQLADLEVPFQGNVSSSPFMRPVLETPTAPEISGESEYLEVLKRWLDLIRERRGHVQ
jgi:tetratricopeptide (TPR) repeat protein